MVVFQPEGMRSLPPDLSRFVLSHYLDTGFRGGGLTVRVAGRSLQPSDLEGHRATVSLVASAEYAVRARGGTPRVSIDGQMYQGPLFLAQGEHQVVVEGAFQELAIFYSRALAVPFQGHDRPAKTHPDQNRPRPSQRQDE